MLHRIACPSPWRALLLAILLPAVPARAIPPPVESFDGATIRCSSYASAATLLICRDPSLFRLDREVRRLFQRASADSGLSAPQKAALTTEQQRWVEQREACWRSASPPTWDADLHFCVQESTVLRLHQLRQAASSSSSSLDGAAISSGPVPLFCPRIKGPLTITFVEGDPGFAVLESHGRVRMLTRSRSASGARYTSASDAGLTLLWINGRQARVDWPALGLVGADCRFQPQDGPLP